MSRLPPRLRLAAALACLLAFAPGVARAAAVTPPGFTDELVVGNLAAPTSFAFLPDGRVLLTEQFTGAIRLVANGSLAPGALAVVPQLTADFERGLLSIAVDPGWPARPYVYVHYTRAGDVMRLARFTASGDLSDAASTALALGDLHVVLDGLADAAFNHNGGALRFGPDGYLYFSVGDDANGCAAQDSTSLRGCLMRLDVGGLPPGPGGPPPRAELVPADNPFAALPDSNARLVFAYGLRNPFRFHIDPATGLVYLGDVGESAWEELDELRPGDNAGWPHREGPALFTNGACPEPGGPWSGAFTRPIASYGHDQGLVVISAGVLRRGPGSAWPATWEGNVFYADYYTGFLRMLAPGPSGWQPAPVGGQPNPSDWATGLAFAVDFLWGPDGDLWWLAQYGGASGGMLRRIRATGGAVAAPEPPPAARLALTVAPNPAGAEARFDLALPEAGPVSLEVLDVQGRRVAVAIGGDWRAAGRHAAAVGTSELEPGVYFARLTFGGSVRKARFAVLR